MKPTRDAIKLLESPRRMRRHPFLGTVLVGVVVAAQAQAAFPASPRGALWPPRAFVPFAEELSGEREPTHVQPNPGTPLSSERQRLVDAAIRLVESRKRFVDCSSFVQGAFARAELRLDLRSLPGRSNSEALFRMAKETEAPTPGDIAVFHNSYDRNRDGKRNDLYTHIAVVERVEGDRVTLLHRGSKGLARIRMNLSRPDDPSENSILRFASKRQPGRIFTGELFAGYGVLIPGDSEHN